MMPGANATKNKEDARASMSENIFIPGLRNPVRENLFVGQKQLPTSLVLYIFMFFNLLY